MDIVLKKNNFIADISKLASAAILTQVLGILLSPILSRIFPPDVFGTVAIFNTLLGII